MDTQEYVMFLLTKKIEIDSKFTTSLNNIIKNGDKENETSELVEFIRCTVFDIERVAYHGK